MSAQPIVLTVEQAKAALADAIAAFDTAENIQAIRAAAAAVAVEQRAMAVLPIVQQIQAGVLAKYGFVGPSGVFQACAAATPATSEGRAARAAFCFAFRLPQQPVHPRSPTHGRVSWRSKRTRLTRRLRQGSIR